jgi:hypothetical protein
LNIIGSNQHPDVPDRKRDKMVSRIKIGFIAAAAHEINSLYCVALGDTSQPPWFEAPQWQIESAMEGVEAIIEYPDITPEQQHDKWRELKLADGWVYGPEKDSDKKTHPCMVDYRDLPACQRAKDTIFGAVVRGLLSVGHAEKDVGADNLDGSVNRNRLRNDGQKRT